MVHQQLPGLGGHPRNISPETLLIQASETLASLNAMTTDLAFELEGANRHKLLATQHLIVLGERLVERVMVLTQGTQTGFQS